MEALGGHIVWSLLGNCQPILRVLGKKITPRKTAVDEPARLRSIKIGKQKDAMPESNLGNAKTNTASETRGNSDNAKKTEIVVRPATAPGHRASTDEM